MLLRPAEEFRGQALRILDTQRAQLRALRVPGRLVLIGGSSVAGALTRGDVDLHLRVDVSQFAAVISVLRQTHDVVHPEIWGPTLATFEVRSAPLPTGLAVTPVGSKHDRRFTRSWQLLAADPALLTEHNAVKRGDVNRRDVRHGVADDGDTGYEERKSAFFDRLVELWPEHPAGGLAIQGTPTCAD